VFVQFSRSGPSHISFSIAIHYIQTRSRN
jgi:hypothetical protein